ncbi:MAG: CDC48 family AAA ATPase [Thermoplasmata archaeon]|nr:CDC48 family AAA ATPase [Thermoplasmata archaeon]MCK5396664.1 CDC48 family AAA ATPase [Thermoplasmata archaeon]
MPKSMILKVERALDQSDVGFGKARLDTKTRLDLGLEVEDIIEIIGKSKTTAKVYKLLQGDEGKGLIRICNLLRQSAGASPGDKVEVRKADVKPASKIVLAPAVSQGTKVRFGEGIEEFIKRGLGNRPVVKGDTILIPGVGLTGNLPFSVISTSPKDVVIMTGNTVLELKEEAVDVEDEYISSVAYEDIGGLHNQLQRIREMIELPLRHPELFRRLGIDPPKGVLLYGPPGTGKTLIAKAVANEAGASFYSIQGPEIMSKYYGGSEEKLREKFEDAEKNSPSIIFIDELDSIAPKRDEVQGEVERRVVAQLLTLMDGMSSRGNVIVIAATNREDSIDEALRRPGRFDREIEIGVPDRDGRKEILEIHTRGMPIAGDDLSRSGLLDEFAAITHGFVGADLSALGREAAMKALRRYLPEFDLDQPIPTDVIEKMEVTRDDFRDALKEVEPSAMREVLVEIPDIGWDDVGGLEDVKIALKEAVELPLKDPDAFIRLGITPPRGVLLYGPPGTGKSMLAKAVANESEANFISIKGPEVMSKWLGESEKAVRQIFKKAKQVSPSIVFLDEIDSIAPARGSSQDSGATERVVNQILTSLDGMENMDGIVVIAATNRPDIIDHALLRTGRFDRLVYVGVPDREARKSIFKVHTSNMPLSGVDLDWLADSTEGYVGADIEGVCREAGMIALRKDINAKEIRKSHFEESLKAVRPSATKETIKYYEAIREALESGKPETSDKGGLGYYA